MKPDPSPSSLPSFLLIAALVGIVVLLVASTLGRPEPPAFPPTPVDPAEVGHARVGPVIYTVDARDTGSWRYFDFSRGSTVRDPGPTGWDLAFQRTRIGANGGDAFPGSGGVVDLGAVPFDSVRAVPSSGYLLTKRDTLNPAVEDWYDYSMLSHILTPKPRVYAVRTADGRFAKLEILAYYCPEAEAGCLTFRYEYQGGGSRSFPPARR